MKYLVILSLLMYLAINTSCNNNGNSSQEQPHTHKADQPAAHIHEGEDTTAHTHKADATIAHVHESDTGSAHSHEPVTTSGTVANFKYTSVKLSKQSFHFVIKTSGSIMLDNKSDISITASSSGIVRFNDSFLYPGILLNKGDILFKIAGENLTEDNTALNFARVESDYNRAKKDFERASGLIEDKLITQDHFLEKKNIFEKAELEYKIYKTNISANQTLIKSPLSGFLNEIFVNEGDKVEAGDKLASIQAQKHMVLRADIPPSEFDIIDGIKSAKFTTGYSMKVYNTNEMNGSLLSYGRSSGENSFYIPLFFKFDYNKDLIAGAFVDIWLIGEEIEDAIVIPNSSILEEYGKFYVYIDHGDHFDKRYISPGRSDGERTMVLSGLHEDESIVSDGVYQVKMSMITSIPNTHNHSH